MSTSNPASKVQAGSHPRIEGAVALVTGANRGLGRHFAEQLRKRGAAVVWTQTLDGRPPRYAPMTGLDQEQVDRL